ncbi:MAG: BatA domain-containing protein, partial [Rhodoblastus sp.]
MGALPLAFAAPLALAGLLALPAIWLLLRVTPPRPRRLPFPPLRILFGGAPRDETPARTPWWLLALRLCLAALACLAFAGPIWNPPAASSGGAGPLLIALDESWAAAPTWDARRKFAIEAAEAAGRRSAPVAVAAMSDGAREIIPNEAARAIEILRARRPQPASVSRAAALQAIETFADRNKNASALWIADGLEQGGARAFAEKMAALFGASLEIASDAHRVRALAGPRNEAQGLVVRVLGAQSGGEGNVRALDQKGALLAEAPFALQDRSETEARIALPVELRNEVARIEIAGEHSAGAVALLDDRWKRRRVGVVSGASADVAQPLLAPNYYVSRALGPFADIRQARAGSPDPIGVLLDEGVDMLVVSDMAISPGPTHDRLEKFVENGGALVRFAGTRLAGANDGLTPVRLRRAGRVLGGALSWETPKKLSAFDDKSPFHGLRIPQDVTVSRQVLAEPEPGLPARTWAQLADQTPLVTAERRGKGLIVLFHITADTTWSNLPISGLFPEMLHKIAMLAGASAHAAPAEQDAASQAPAQKTVTLAPQRVLDGFGALVAPPVTARAISADFQGPATLEHPPGFYGAGDAAVAVNALGADAKLKAVDLAGLAGRRLGIEAARAIDLRAPLMAAAFVLLVVDALASLWLSGGLPRFPSRKTRAALVLAVFVAAGFIQGAPFSTTPALAQSAKSQPLKPQPLKPQDAQKKKAPTKRDIEAALSTRLAYVVTGDARVDETSRAGLESLSQTLLQRTAL